MMKKAYLALPLCLALGGIPTLALSAEPAPPAQAAKDPYDEAVKEILEVGTGSIDIAPDQRGDLSACGGVSSQGVLRAIQTCWPILQIYKTYSPLAGAMAKWEALPRARHPLVTSESIAASKIADDIIAGASDRAYPAQDAPLMIAHLSKGLIAIAQDDIEGFVAQFTKARDIIASSRIEAIGFKGSLVEIEKQLAGAADLLATRKAAAAK